MKKLFFACLAVCLSISSAQAAVLEFSFLEGVDCDGPFSVHQNFDLPPSISAYAGEVRVETGGYMSVYNDTDSPIYTNFSSDITVRAKLLNRWAFDDLAVIDDYLHFTSTSDDVPGATVQPGDTHYESISRDITKFGQIVRLSPEDQADLGVLGRIKVDGECNHWFVGDSGAPDALHKFVKVTVRLYYRP